MSGLVWYINSTRASGYISKKIFKPWHMHKGYGSCFMCPSVTMLAATYMYLVYMSKTRQCIVSCRLVLCGLC